LSATLRMALSSDVRAGCLMNFGLRLQWKPSGMRLIGRTSELAWVQLLGWPALGGILGKDSRSFD